MGGLIFKINHWYQSIVSLMLLFYFVYSSPHHQMYPMLMNPPHSPMVTGSQSSMLSSSPLMSNSPMLSNNSPLMQYSPYSDVLPSPILAPLGPSGSSNQVDESVSWGYPMNSAFSSEFCSNYGMYFCQFCSLKILNRIFLFH